MATQAAPSSGVVSAVTGLPVQQPGLRVHVTPADASQTPDATAPSTPAAADRAERISTDNAVRKLTEALRSASVSIQFEIDHATNKVVTKIVDKANGEVIRQIPTEEVVRIADAMAQLQGLFVHQTA
jgi:flagellar protein FlaG